MTIAAFALGLLMTTIPHGEQRLQSGDGVEIWWNSAGSGPPIVVIHGGPGLDHASLAADLTPLEKTRTVIYYDQRGGGRSSLPADPALLTIDHHVRDLEALRVRLGLEKLTLLAHSFGPAIAARYAIAHPDRVERLIFLGPIPPRKGTFFEDYGATLRSRIGEAGEKRADDAYKRMMEGTGVTAACRDYWAVGIPPRLAKGVDVSVVKSDLCTAPAAAIRFGMKTTGEATWASLGDWDWRVELEKVKAPTLVIHGDEDAIPLTQVREWISAMPAARILVLERTGHFPHAEKPAIVFPAIEEFLKGKWPVDAKKK